MVGSEIVGRMQLIAATYQLPPIAVYTIPPSLSGFYCQYVQVSVLIASPDPTATAAIVITWNDDAGSQTFTGSPVGIGLSSSAVQFIRPSASQPIKVGVNITGTGIYYNVYSVTEQMAEAFMNI